MKIAVWHNLPSGGGKRALYYHVRGLVERGHTVESWCPPTADQTYLPLNELVPEHVVPLSQKPRAFKLRSGIHDVLEAMDEHCRKCAEAINQGGFDLFLGNSSQFSAVAPIGRYVTLPKLINLGEPSRGIYEAMPQLPWQAAMPPAPGFRWSPRRLTRGVRDRLTLEGLRTQVREEWLNAHAYDTMLVNSYYSRETMLRVYGYDAKVCYTGVDLSIFHPIQRERERFIVSVGAFITMKGIDRAIQSVALLVEPRPPLVWICNFGDKDYMEEMTRLAASLKVDLQIRMRLSDEEMVDTLNRAALFLYTAKLEPFGFAPLEANACATPVVAVAEGGVRETVVDGVNGFLCDPDPRRLAQAMQRLVDDPALARRQGEAAAEHVQQKWNIEHGIDRLEAFLLEQREAATGTANAAAAGVLLPTEAGANV